jgi:hypothetical protein
MERRSASSVPRFRGFGTCHAVSRLSPTPTLALLQSRLWLGGRVVCVFELPDCISGCCCRRRQQAQHCFGLCWRRRARIRYMQQRRHDYSRPCLTSWRMQTLIGSAAAHPSPTLALLRRARPRKRSASALWMVRLFRSLAPLLAQSRLHYSLDGQALRSPVDWASARECPVNGSCLALPSAPHVAPSHTPYTTPFLSYLMLVVHAHSLLHPM